MRRPGRARGERGQMTVELAVLVPIVIVVALTIVNLMRYVDACSAFDRLCADIVVSEGVAPSGGSDMVSAVEAVRSELSSALGRGESCSVEVSAARLSDDGVGLLSEAPLLTRFTCRLVYRPWPRELRLPGVTYQAPITLTHEREIVVDRYRPGVVF